MRRVEPTEMHTVDGHVVRRYPRRGGWLVLCAHPSCACADGQDRTKDGVIVAEPPVWVIEAQRQHVAMHDERDASRP